MQFFTLSDMKGGWFVGDFEPSAFRVSEVEVAFTEHGQGAPWPTHYHRVATEITLVVSGRMTINGVEVCTGGGFVLAPNELAAPEFLTDCNLVVVKIPSVPGDKHVVAQQTC